MKQKTNDLKARTPTIAKIGADFPKAGRTLAEYADDHGGDSPEAGTGQ